jgi:hypothetical protein
LTAKKQIQEGNRRVIKYVSDQMDKIQKSLFDFNEQVKDSNQVLWQNQQQQKSGMDEFEEHILILRRVLNDALGGITRVTTVERRKEGSSDENEEAQVIDWGWYSNQIDHNLDRDGFMNGQVLSDEQIEEAIAKKKKTLAQNLVLFAVGQAAEKDEDQLRKLQDDECLIDWLEDQIPKNHEWDHEMMDPMVPEVVKQVLGQRKAARDQQAKLDSAKERLMVKSAIAKVVAAGDEEVLRSGDLEAKAKVVAASLPTVVQWTPSMQETLDEVIEEVLEKMDAENKENDPEEVEQEKQKLLEETKRFGDDAEEVIDLIQSGKKEEAQAAMAKLDEKVKAKEAEAAKNAPHVPDGATVFGD